MLTRAATYEALCATGSPGTCPTAAEHGGAGLRRLGGARARPGGDHRPDRRVGAMCPTPSLRRLADGLAHELVARGVTQRRPGGCAALARCLDCAAAHIAIWKIGAISDPALQALHARGAAEPGEPTLALNLIITDPEGAEMLDGHRTRTFFPEDLALPDDAVLTRHETGPETDPAVLIYTSGTTGSAKGALHGHRVLTGHLPGRRTAA